MKKSVKVSEKLVSPGLPGLQVASCLVTIATTITIINRIVCILLTRGEYIMCHGPVYGRAKHFLWQ